MKQRRVRAYSHGKLNVRVSQPPQQHLQLNIYHRHHYHFLILIYYGIGGNLWHGRNISMRLILMVVVVCLFFFS